MQHSCPSLGILWIVWGKILNITGLKVVSVYRKRRQAVPRQSLVVKSDLNILLKCLLQYSSHAYWIVWHRIMTILVSIHEKTSVSQKSFFCFVLLFSFFKRVFYMIVTVYEGSHASQQFYTFFKSSLRHKK